MIAEIADLLVEIPEAGDLVPRCQGYLVAEEKVADIVLKEEEFRLELWKNFSRDFAIYAESGLFFHFELLKFNGMSLHASAVELDGRAYLFSAPSGTGKSTHTQLWQSVFGEKAHIFNDDKPALRNIDGTWYAYGTPWSGHGGNLNMKVPLASICFLRQAPENKIRRLNPQEAVQKMIWQTMHRFKKVENLDLMLSRVEELVQGIPIFELENRPEPEAALLSYETMRRAAEELGL